MMQMVPLGLSIAWAPLPVRSLLAPAELGWDRAARYPRWCNAAVPWSSPGDRACVPALCTSLSAGHRLRSQELFEGRKAPHGVEKQP